MSEPLSDSALDQLFRTARTFNGYLDQPVSDAQLHAIWDLMKTARGHRMAKSGIETACWDLEAKKLGVPLWKHLGGVNQTIECGVSIGIQDSVEQLIEKIRVEVEAGRGRHGTPP